MVMGRELTLGGRAHNTTHRRCAENCAPGTCVTLDTQCHPSKSNNQNILINKKKSIWSLLCLTLGCEKSLCDLITRCAPSSESCMGTRRGHSYSGCHHSQVQACFLRNPPNEPTHPSLLFVNPEPALSESGFGKLQGWVINIVMALWARWPLWQPRSCRGGAVDADTDGRGHVPVRLPLGKQAGLGPRRSCANPGLCRQTLNLGFWTQWF